MKTMTCNQLGGACEEKFQADSFEKIGELSRSHAMQMFAQEDKAHLDAAEEMKKLMQDPSAMKQWFESKKAMFESLPDD